MGRVWLRWIALDALGQGALQSLITCPSPDHFTSNPSPYRRPRKCSRAAVGINGRAHQLRSGHTCRELLPVPVARSPAPHARAMIRISQGRWGDASTSKKPNTIYAEFIGQVHMLTLTGGGGYESIRCSDGEAVKGKLATAGE